VQNSITRISLLRAFDTYPGPLSVRATNESELGHEYALAHPEA
jgi:hypothetical protein